VLDGNALIDLGDPPERLELPRGSVCVVQPGTSCSSGTTATRTCFIVGAPPEEGGADYLPDVA